MNRLLLMLLFLGLTACSRPFKTPLLDPPKARFDGLFAELRPGGGAPVPIDVISVHGMCTHDREWVVRTGRRLAEGLSLDYRAPVEWKNVQGIELWINDLEENGDVLVRNYAIVWSPLTAPDKAKLCRDSSEATLSCRSPGYSRKRASINGAVKSELMNDCFSDAVIYLGPKGIEIRRALRAAIAEIAGERSKTRTFGRPLFLISESLGSKALADALLGEPEEGKDDDDRDLLEDFGSLRQIFMAANQIPLLDLGHPLEKSAPSIERFRDEVQAKRETAFSARGMTAPREPIQLIAFDDPNDLLSYELGQRSENTINVIVSNARTWFGSLELPTTAHRGYLDNDRVWELITCGSEGCE